MSCSDILYNQKKKKKGGEEKKKTLITSVCISSVTTALAIMPSPYIFLKSKKMIGSLIPHLF